MSSVVIKLTYIYTTILVIYASKNDPKGTITWGSKPIHDKIPRIFGAKILDPRIIKFIIYKVPVPNRRPGTIADVYEPVVSAERMRGARFIKFHEKFANLVLDYTVIICGSPDNGTAVLCQALAQGFVEAEGTPHFIYANTVADIKKCAAAGKLQDNVPLVVMGLSHSDKACTPEIVRCIVNKGYNGAIRIPSSTPRIISTSSSPEDWFRVMGQAGMDAVGDMAKGTVWVHVSENVANVVRIETHKGERVKRIADHMKELFNPTASQDVD